MIEIKTLKNGTRVIFEHLPANDIISIGIFVKAGSNYETESTKGISHFIEHMTFKGTATKSAKDIAIVSDQIGGMLNAFTGKDMTCYYIKTTSDNVCTALELMSDMLLHSRLSDTMIESEKKVVIEEIAMYEDSLRILCMTGWKKQCGKAILCLILYWAIKLAFKVLQKT